MTSGAPAAPAGLVLAHVLSAALLLSACGRVDSLEPCDILSESCQLDAYYSVVRMRGDGLDAFGGRPPIRTITLDEYRASLELAAKKDEPEPDAGDEGDDGDDGDEEPVDTRSPRSRAFDTALGLLGLLSPATTSSQASVDDAVGNVTAFYSGGTGEVTVIDRGGERNFERETSTLIHELIHAFQGREPPISFTDGTVDDSFARRGLIEGEAELYEQLSIAEMLDTAAVTLRWEAFYTDWVAGSRRRLGKSRQPYFSISRGFAYPLGGRRMVDAWLHGGNAAVRGVFEARPRTSHYFMALGTGVERLHAVNVYCEPDPPADPMESMILDRFGAAQLYGFLAVQLQDDDSAWDDALGWEGDGLRIYGDEEGDVVALTWRIRLDDEERAERVADAIRNRPPPAQEDDEKGPQQDELPELVALDAVADSQYLVIRAATDAQLLEDWDDGVACE